MKKYDSFIKESKSFDVADIELYFENIFKNENLEVFNLEVLDGAIEVYYINFSKDYSFLNDSASLDDFFAASKDLNNEVIDIVNSLEKKIE